jgi:hypothetical protein
MISWQTCLHQKLPEEVLRVGQRIPHLRKKGRPMRVIFQEKAVDPRPQLGKEVPPGGYVEGFQGRQQRDVEVEFRQLRLGYRLKTEVHEGGRVGVVGHVLGQRTDGFKATHTPPELAVKVESDENSPRFPKGRWDAAQFGFECPAPLEPMFDGIKGNPTQGLAVDLSEPSSISPRLGHLVP